MLCTYEAIGPGVTTLKQATDVSQLRQKETDMCIFLESTNVPKEDGHDKDGPKF